MPPRTLEEVLKSDLGQLHWVRLVQLQQIETLQARVAELEGQLAAQTVQKTADGDTGTI